MRSDGAAVEFTSWTAGCGALDTAVCAVASHSCVCAAEVFGGGAPVAACGSGGMAMEADAVRQVGGAVATVWAAATRTGFLVLAAESTSSSGSFQGTSEQFFFAKTKSNIDSFTVKSSIKEGLRAKVFEGERSLTKDNSLLGNFDLTASYCALCTSLRGTPEFEVTFEVDANGILNVKAEDKASLNHWMSFLLLEFVGGNVIRLGAYLPFQAASNPERIIFDVKRLIGRN
nr:luminal-binding protein 4-like [Ipomoea trifida]